MYRLSIYELLNFILTCTEFIWATLSLYHRIYDEFALYDRRAWICMDLSIEIRKVWLWRGPNEDMPVSGASMEV